MTDLSGRLEQLSPAKRALLEKLAARGAAGPAAAEPIRPRQGGGPAPLSFGQQRLWFLDRLEPGTPLHTIPAAFRLRGRLDARALRDAFGEVVSRHEALRTVFREVEGTPLQLVLPAVPTPLATADLRALPASAREAEAERRVRDFLRLPFDLARGPLVRAFAAMTGEDTWMLAFAVHHVTSDGWSQGILLRELSAAYAARVGADAPPLPPPAVQYPDFAAWQRGWLRGRLLDEQLAWWKARLAGAAPTLELPADHPRPAVLAHRGAKHLDVLPAGLAGEVEAFARAEGATPFMVLLAAFQLLLGRLSGEDEVRVGTPVANRSRPETEGTIGFFVNTLVLRGDLSGDPGFRALLARVRDEALGAFAHPDLPFERLVEELAPERGLGHAPLVQVSFALQNASDAVLRLPGCDIEEGSPDLGVATLDLDFHLRRSARGLELMARYSTELFEPATIARLAERYARLLRAALADPDAPVSTLPLLDDAERARVLEEWNATRRPYPAGTRVHDLFAAQAARTPDAVAVSWRGERTTYAELDRRASRLAHALRGRGVGPEARVGVCTGRTPELVVALLAVLRAGGAYVPLDPAYPRERLRWMVEDAGIRLVVTESRHADALPENVAEVLVLDREREALAAEPESAPEDGTLPENLSHVIFTSGSTGRPKGVMIRHASTVVLLRWLRESVSDEERSSVLFSTSINFDVSVAEVFGTLCWGGKLVLVENALELPAAGEPVVYASMVPSAAAELLRGGGIPPSVRTLNLGGEALPLPLAQALYDLGTVDRVGNLYGPTEDTTYSTYSLVARDGSRVLVGRPVANTRAYVLDRHLQPVPAGVAGELYLAGDGLSRGYASRPELTAERFLPDPFGEPGTRMYRVMDRVRRTPAGELDYLGRVDFQVKVRGFRIEPGEIEAALLAHPAVSAAVAVVREDEPGRQALVAYVAADEPAPSPAELREQVKRTLPEYMVPGVFVVLDALPRTPNGKTDRGALPAPDPASAAEAYVALRTPEEALLAAIWADLLGAERVGATDDFFALGGHSLLAARLVARVRAETGTELPLRALFEDSTVAALALRLREAAGEGADTAPPSPRPMPRGDGAPLSFAQERLWFIDRMDPGNTAYHVPQVVRIRGPLDPAALRRALAAVAARHEALRTTFADRGESAVQVVAAPAPVALPVVDLARLEPAARERTARALAAADAARPFDLRRGPLLRAALLRLDPAEHALVLTLHHVVTDGWSMGVLFRDLSASYAATGGGEAALPPLPLQYADFAVWQRMRLRGGTLERELAFWRERLAGAPALLELPTDHPRSAVRGRRGGRVETAVPADTAAALRRLGREQGTTLFMTLLAGFQLLLSRYAGQEDVVVGTPIAGRTHRELEELVGFFVNALAVRTDLSGDPDFRELLRRTREAALGAFAHQEVPFERLVEELAPERSLSHSPIFQAMFTLQGGEGEGLRLPGASTSVEEVWSGRAKYDLSVAVRDEGGGLTGVLGYDAALFEPATAERMAAHFVALLGAAAAAPGERVSSLALVDEAERRRLAGWNDSAREHPCLPAHELFAAQAARTPDALAVACGAERLTYAELDAASSRIARALRGLGVGVEARVAVCLEPSAGMAAAILGVLKAGGAYVPLDPAYPAERLRLVLEDADARVLLAREPLAAKLPAAGLATLLLDRDAARIAALDGGPLEGGAGPDGLAYVIYTSGSTGRPKGVLVEHRGLANLLQASRGEFGFREGDVAPALASFAFDIWGFETLVPLVSGGAVRMVPRERVMDVPALLEECRDATVLHAVPALMRQVVEAGRGALPELRRLFVGGDLVPPELLEAMRTAFPEAETRVLYGPTEGTVLAAAHPVGGGAVPERPVIGRPLANVRLYVRGGAGELLPAGIPGELYIGGRGVARGYLGRPDLTAASFVPDPFGEPGTRLYRTGDRARWRTDGTLEFLGRVDFQVKVRGFRIEPGEVESALLAHPEVHDAAVVAREDRPGEPRLVAYVVPAQGAVPAQAALRAWLRDRLPEHMVPGALVVLDAFPLTPAGKTDRRALPGPDDAAHAEGFAAPRTPTEELLASVWSEVLGVERVGAHDHFFELGGHSLLATRVASRVRSVLGAELPLRAVFESPTLAELAGRVDAALREEQGVRLPPLVPVPRDGGAPLPTSFAQERLWVLHQMDPASPAYGMPFPFRLRGPLDVAALRRALEALAERHEPLRTVLPAVDGAPVQRVLPPAPFPLPVADLSALPPEAREARIRQLADEDAARPFDLEHGPLFRAALLRADAEDHVLLLGLHHAVSDGWSMGVLFHELGALYGAVVEGRPSTLLPLPVQYADFAAWQRSWLAGEALQRQIAWWRERLADAPPVLELPTDRARPAVRTGAGAEHRFVLPAGVRPGVEALARAAGATPFMVLLAAWQLLLARYADADEVVVGTPIAGRTHEAVEGLIGFFVNTLALRTDLSGDPDFRGLLARVRETTLGAYHHQDLPFEKLVEELHPERSLSYDPVFQVTFALQNAPVAAPALAGIELAPLPASAATAKFDLSLGLAERDGALAGVLGYATDLFDAATIERIAERFGTLLERIAADPDARLSSLSLLAAAERQRVLEEWNRTAAPLRDVCVHHLFAEQVERTPHALALLAGGEALTYRALAERVGGLAARLRERGVGPETPVGVLAEPGAELVAALLGVLAAGGVYVPLDPAYPRERLAFVLANSGARVVVAEERVAGMLPEFGGEVVELASSPTKGVGERDRVRVGFVARGTGDAGAPSHSRTFVLTDSPAPDHLAYVIYTSGSTGTPKGVQVEHRGLAALLQGVVDGFGLRAGDVMPCLASFAFDISLFEMLAPLVCGGTLRMVLRERVRDVRALVEEELADATLLHAVPALMREVVETARASGRGLPKLRRVFVGGDAVPPDLLPAMAQAFPAAEVRILYGPTEATILAASHRVRAGEPVDRSLLGRPLPNVRAYVLDRGGEPVPSGVPGELYVGGRGVARGYLGRPELTAERFVPDPFSGEAGARLYRTGDRARWSADGCLEFLGRTDMQVKVRGFRIEPGEVEAAICALPGVRDAVVVVREDVPGDRRLVGYVVPRDGVWLDAAELRAALRGRLPEHMLPSALVVLDALPLTATGKVDRKALPAPDTAGAAGAGDAPRTPEEEILAGIWAEVLGTGRVGIHDDFFALGGHSLLATRVVSRIRAVLGAELPLRALFESPTVAGLAETVRAGRGEVAPPVVPVPRDRPLPLSFSQQRLWFLDRMEPVNAHHNIVFALRLEGALDADALERSLAEVVRRHEALRTVFRQVEGEATQVVLPTGGFRLGCVDLAVLPAAEREPAMRALAEEELRRPTDLEAGPLFRASLLRLAPDEHVLVLMIHHAVSDAWSFGVLYRELSALYPAFAGGAAQPSPLAPLPVQYADHAAWQRDHLRGEALERQLAYWRGRLEGAPALLELPTDRPRPALQTHRAAVHGFALPAGLADGIRALDRREGVTPFMTFLAALAVVLRRMSGQDDVVVGTPIAGRTRAETEGLIGFFVNMLALRTDLGGDPSFRELLARVRETTLGAYAHQDVPFEKLLEELRIQRSLAHASVYQVSLILHNAATDPPRLPGVRTSAVDVRAQATPFDLTLVVAEDADGGMRGSLTYNADLFDESTAAAYAALLRAVLEDAVAEPEAPISRIAPVLEEERALQVERWNATAQELPSHRPVHELISETALRTPDAPAVVQEGAATLTFAELERRADALADRLAAIGVEPEVRVALCMERSPEMLAALLAVLRAGGCYVPVDPAYPAERIQYMLADSGARVLLTQERLAATLPQFGGDVVCVDEASSPPGPRGSGRGPALDPDNAAYVIYTSGSTGRPKGVVATHRALANYAAAAVDLYGVTPADRVLQFASLSFDASAEEIYPALLGGAALVLRTEEMLASAATFFERCAEWGVTVLDLPTAYWHELVAELERGVVRLPESIRLVIIGGERALPERVATWRRQVGDGVRLVNTYGPTEATVVATLAELQGREEAPLLPEQPLPQVPIGGPVPNGRVYVLDREMRLLPIGARGELYVGGAGVARGYLDRPELTAERFVPDPFSAEAGARLYRTGDVVRWLRGGELEFVGRADQQVKVRGYRIEPGEIEDLLLRHPGVRDAVVAAREDEPGRTRLVGYVVAEGEAPGAAELRAHLKAELPEHMVPAAFVVLDALPLTPSGKVDRSALPAPDAQGAPAEVYVAPATDAERRLAEIWAEVLRVERVGARDDFFALGGHSLLATQVVARVRQAFGAELPLRSLFEHPTVAGLAALLPAEVPAAEPVPGDTIAASTSGMEGELLDRIDELSDAEIERLLAGLSTETGFGA